MSVLYLDLEYGISGDMFAAALADLGVDFRPLEQALQRVVPGVRMGFREEIRHGVKGRAAVFGWENNQPLRMLQDIYDVLDRMDIPADVSKRSKLAFEGLARVEASVHGVGLDRVHFHEVGALDTIMDIVGAFWGLKKLGIRHVRSSEVPWFRGKVQTAHGELPLPAPATTLLLQGKKIRPSEYDWEIITPTGALLLDQLVEEYSPGFSGTLKQSGTGFGKKKKGFNGLRVFVAETPVKPRGYLKDQVWVLTTNIDHLTGEELGVFLEEIMQTGALDVIYLPGIMKKNRPGFQVQVMCGNEDLGQVQDAFFKHTLTLGMRIQCLERSLLPRKNTQIMVDEEMLQAKEVLMEGRTYTRPEMQELQKLAHKKNASVVQLRLVPEEKSK